MEWYKIFLTNEQIRNGVQIQIQDQFTNLWMKLKAPKDVTMFDDARTEVKGKTIYFSPGAIAFMIDIINQYLGEETERPNINEVALLVGHDSAWGLLK
jgi:hypothetical protein